MSFGKDSPDIAVPGSSFISTDGFALKSQFEPGPNAFVTNLRRTGSPEQAAFAERFPRILSDIDTLRGTITPGASLVREARLKAVEDARQRAISNLRDNLARRGIAGSSFAASALGQTEALFGRERQTAEAQSFLEEFELNRTILTQESGQLFAALQRELAELGVAANFGQNFANLNLQAQVAEASLAAQESSSLGKGFGSLFGFTFGKILNPSLSGIGDTLAKSLALA